MYSSDERPRGYVWRGGARGWTSTHPSPSNSDRAMQSTGGGCRCVCGSDLHPSRPLGTGSPWPHFEMPAATYEAGWQIHRIVARCTTREQVRPHPMSKRTMPVTIKTPSEIEKMRVAGRPRGGSAGNGRGVRAPGVTTEDLDRICHEHIVRRQQAIPANLGWASPGPCALRSTTSSATASPVPPRCLRDGDIVNIDVTVIRDGFHGDTSRINLGKARRARPAPVHGGLRGR